MKECFIIFMSKLAWYLFEITKSHWNESFHLSLQSELIWALPACVCKMLKENYFTIPTHMHYTQRRNITSHFHSNTWAREAFLFKVKYEIRSGTKSKCSTSVKTGFHIYMFKKKTNLIRHYNLQLPYINSSKIFNPLIFIELMP